MDKSQGGHEEYGDRYKYNGLIAHAQGSEKTSNLKEFQKKQTAFAKSVTVLLLYFCSISINILLLTCEYIFLFIGGHVQSFDKTHHEGQITGATHSKSAMTSFSQDFVQDNAQGCDGRQALQAQNLNLNVNANGDVYIQIGGNNNIIRDHSKTEQTDHNAKRKGNRNRRNSFAGHATSHDSAIRIRQNGRKS